MPDTEKTREQLLDEIAGLRRRVGELERAGAEEVLRKAEERLSRAQRLAHVASWERDLTNGDGRWSDELCQLLGYEPGEVAGSYELFMQHVHSDDAERVGNTIQQALRAVGSFDVDFRYVRRDGAVGYGRCVGEAVGDASGRAVHVAGAFQDTSDRERAAHALRGERAHLEAVLRQMPAGVIVVDASGRLVLANEKTRQMGGQDGPWQTVEDCFRSLRVFHADGRPCRLEEWPLARTMESGETVQDEEFDFLRPNGSLGTMVVNSAPIYDRAGNVLSAVLTFRDITERKRMAEALRKSGEQLEIQVVRRTAQLRRTNEALLETNALLERIFNNAHVMTAYMDTAFVFIRVNRAYAAADGRTPEFFTGRNHFDLYPNADNEKIFRTVVRTGEPYFAYEKPFEYAERPERGVTYWDWSLQPVRDASGEVDGLVLFLVNVTERCETEMQIMDYQEQLRSLVVQAALTEQRERRRIATALHDSIGQALAVSQMKLGEIRRFLSPQGAPAQASATGTVDFVRELIEQSLESTHALIFELSPPSLYQYGLEAALDQLCRNMSEQHQLAIHLERFSETGELAEEIAVLLFQTVRELVINVVKHAQASRVDIMSVVENDVIYMKIQDDGVGFDASRLPAAGSRRGGFGLFSLQERLGRIAGCIEMHSRPGEGTAAIVIAPLKPLGGCNDHQDPFGG